MPRKKASHVGEITHDSSVYMDIVATRPTNKTITEWESHKFGMEDNGYSKIVPKLQDFCRSLVTTKYFGNFYADAIVQTGSDFDSRIKKNFQLSRFGQFDLHDTVRTSYSSSECILLHGEVTKAGHRRGR